MSRPISAPVACLASIRAEQSNADAQIDLATAAAILARMLKEHV